MCIRDSHGTVPGGFPNQIGARHGVGRISDAGINIVRLFLRFQNDLVPVSYTHLDVYKRQARPHRGRAAQIPGTAAPAPGNPDPRRIPALVSYTHLDV